jgi:hypothetical protein
VRICVPVVSIPTTPYETSFDVNDPRFIGSVIRVTHGRNVHAPLVALFNGSDIERPSAITVISANMIEVDLTYETVIGTWNLGVLQPMYESSFDASDPRFLTTPGKLTITHGLGRNAPVVAIYDDTGVRQVWPVNLEGSDPTNKIEIELDSNIVSNTWWVGVG